LEDKNGRVLARVVMTKNRMFKLNLKIKVLSVRREGKVQDVKEDLKTSKALKTKMVEMEAAKNKAHFMAHMLKD